MEARLLTKYKEEIAPKLFQEFGYKNRMQIPKVSKVVLNVGLGEGIQNPKLIDSAVKEMEAITGQHVIVTKARKSIATFKLRLGMRIGASVTLRGPRMYEFLDRLLNVALPRVRDFRGVSEKSFDGRGNYSLGIKEQIIFPEVDYDNIEKIHGMNITIVTSARNDEEAKALLTYMGMPFRNRK